MESRLSTHAIVKAAGEVPTFRAGDAIRVLTPSPIGHYRVPTYLRGTLGVIEAVIQPPSLDNEQEGHGSNAGAELHWNRRQAGSSRTTPGAMIITDRADIKGRRSALPGSMRNEYVHK